MKKLLVCTSLILANSAMAQTADFVQLVPSFHLPKDVNFAAGAIVLNIPKYSGADDRRFALYPMFDAQWKNGAFLSARNGLGYNFSKDPALTYGVRLSWHAARDESRSIKLKGLGDVTSAIEPGAFLNFNLSPNFSLNSSLRYGSGIDHNGVQISFGGSATTALNNQHRLSANLAATWSNSNYMQSYYGVNAQQAINSAYNQYTPSAGISEVKLATSWHWNIDSNWSLTTGASVSRLTGDAGRSPFVFNKSPVTFFSTANYRF